MKLSVSNIAWSPEEDDAAFDILQQIGIPAIEIAPTRLWPDWRGIATQSIQRIRKRVSEHGLQVSSLQAVLFAKPDLRLFGSMETRAALADHLVQCGELCHALGGTPMVFGAPKNRNAPPGLPPGEAFRDAVKFFQDLAPRLARTQSELAIEANPREYGAEFLTSATDAVRLVRAVDRSAIRLHLDTACMHLAGDDWKTLILGNADILAHFHMSEPYLADFANSVCSHADIAATLREIGYRGWVTLEMRRPAAGLQTVRDAIESLVRWYGGRVYATV